MSRREDQQARYWLTEKGWAAASCVSPASQTTPAAAAPTTHQETSR